MSSTTHRLPDVDDDLDLSAPLVVGHGVTGRAVTDALIRRGHRPVTVIDDRADLTVDDDEGRRFVLGPSAEELEAEVSAASVVLPSPGVPDHHPVFAAAAAAGVPIRSEFDLARRWDRRPTVAITGTNGKTTVTTLVTDAIERSGRRAVAVGNTPVPLVDAIDDVDVEVFVIEASSFRLAHSHRFAPDVATWLNFSPDHLDAHASLHDYERAKASIWEHLADDAVVVANIDDPVVMANVPGDHRPVTFGATTGDWTVADDQVVGPKGAVVAVAELPRRQPHDLLNASAAAATADAAGVPVAAIADALRAFRGLPHRMAEIGTFDDITWFDDSKATVPEATVAGVGGFERVVLIAGGKNKGVDLSPLSTLVPPVHAVVAIGDAAEEIRGVFAPTGVAVHVAGSMDDAVEAAADLARPGDVVVLSPSCTSFDWYADYGQRGDHFAALVTERFAR